MIEKTDWVSIRIAESISGIGPQTLRKLGDQNQIRCYKTPSGQRKFCKQDLQTMCGIIMSDQVSKNVNKKNFIYARVSSKKQVDDLTRQIQYLESHIEPRDRAS